MCEKSTWSVAFLSLKPQLVQDLQYVISLLFHSLSMDNISKITTNSRSSLEALGLDQVSSSILLNGLGRSQTEGSPTGACKKQELKQFDVEIIHHWTSWQRWKKEHKYYNTPYKFYPSDRAKGSRGAEGWNAYTQGVTHRSKSIIGNLIDKWILLDFNR